MSDTTFHGADFFGRQVFAVRGNNGSVIVSRVSDEEDEEEEEDSVVLSLGAESAELFAKWLLEARR